MRKVMYCGTLFDGVTGKTEKNRVIIIDENKITGVIGKEEYQQQPDDEIIDCTDKFVMPGLIDMHVN